MISRLNIIYQLLALLIFVGFNFFGVYDYILLFLSWLLFAEVGWVCIDIYPRLKIPLYYPQYMFSALYSFYGFGGIYFSFGPDQSGFFVSLVGIDSYELYESGLFQFSTILVILGFTSYVVGSIRAHKRYRYLLVSADLDYSHREFIAGISSKSFFWYGVSLCFSGLLFFWYFVQKMGGWYILVSNFSAYKYLQAEVGISTLPLNLSYAGVYCVSSHFASRLKHKLSIQKSSFILFLIMSILTSLTFLLRARIFAFVAFFASSCFPVLLVKVRLSNVYLSIVAIRKQLLTLFAAAMVPISLTVLVFVYRLENSRSYNNMPQMFDTGNFGDSLDLLAYQLIGRGNIPDIQQIAIAIYHWTGERLLWGESFFDSVRNLVSSGETFSVGYRILNHYFPQKVGGPTPGIVGEFYANFGFIGVLLGMAVFGYISLAVSAKLCRSNGPVSTTLYSMLLFNGFLIICKVDSSVFAGVFVSSLLYVLMVLIYGTARSLLKLAP